MEPAGLELCFVSILLPTDMHKSFNQAAESKNKWPQLGLTLLKVHLDFSVITLLVDHVVAQWAP